VAFCTGYREEAKVNWDERRRNRTEEERGNYPAKHCTDKQWATAEQSCRTRNHIMVTDAAWLWGLCRATWDVPVTRPAGGQDREQPKFEHKTLTATVTAKKPDIEENEIANWMLSHRLEWSQIYGISIAKQICEFIERMQREGKLRGVDKEGAQQILTAIAQDLYAKARLAQAQKKEAVRPQIGYAKAHIGYDPAVPGTDRTAYTFIDASTGRKQTADIIATMGDWKRLSNGEWLLQNSNTSRIARGTERDILEKEYQARRKLQ
jgi:hypothetical protein